MKKKIINQSAIKKEATANTVIDKMKSVSWTIMHTIQSNVGEIKTNDQMLAEIKGKDSIFNVFLKVSALLCKIIILEGKIQDVPTQQEKTKLLKKEAKLDIGIIESFLMRCKNNSKKGV